LGEIGVCAQKMKVIAFLQRLFELDHGDVDLIEEMGDFADTFSLWHCRTPFNRLYAL
jgi:hypothetical protein